MAGLLLHFECVSIGSLSHPAGGWPSHSISDSMILDSRELPSRARKQAVCRMGGTSAVSAQFPATVLRSTSDDLPPHISRFRRGAAGGRQATTQRRPRNL